MAEGGRSRRERSRREPQDALVGGEVVFVALRAAATAGALAGLVMGLVVGSLVGALLTWMAGAILDWQRDLTFTLGVARRLLPFGDQIGLLRTVDTFWYAVIPAGALVVGVVAGVFGALVGALIAATYNRAGRRIRVAIRAEPEARLDGHIPAGRAEPSDAVDDGASRVLAPSGLAGDPSRDRAQRSKL